MLNTNLIKSLTDLRLDPASVIAVAQKTDNPVYIFNRGKPLSVILDIKVYEDLIDRLEDALDSVGMKKFEKKKKNKSDWISHEKLVKKLKLS